MSGALPCRRLYLMCLRAVGILCICAMNFIGAVAQPAMVDGKIFNPYRAGHFRPHRGIYYSLFVSPVLTIDPLGFGEKSTYGISLGSQIRLWESKTPENILSGFKFKGLYTAAGYEYYPQQYDKIYASLWLRIHAFIPLCGKFDYIYATGYGLKGISYRFCAGVEFRKVSLFLCGEYYFYQLLGPHPNSESPYTNAGEIMAIIPVFTRKEK